MARRPWQTKEWKKRRKEILLIRNKCEWCGKTEKLQIAHKKHVEKYTLANPQYLLCADKDIQVLCARCHFAEHKNLTKCPTCDGYKAEWNEVCSKCFRKEHPQEESYVDSPGKVDDWWYDDDDD
jgi:hypothetical protein